MHKKTVLFFLLLSFFIFIQEKAFAFSVNSVRTESKQGHTRVVIEMSREVPYRIFTLNSPERLVVDIPEASWNAAAPFRDKSGTFREYRRGIFKKNTLRLVFDLTRPAAVQSAYFLPTDPTKKPRLIIDTVPCTKAAFLKNLSAIHGISADPVLKEAGNTVPASAKKPVLVLDEKTYAKNKTVIVIDPGHGGNDPGAIASNGIKEKNITLAMAKTLRDKLSSTGLYTVYLTRETDKFIKLRDRTKFARNRNAELFISLHADSIMKDGVQGASIYTLSDKASDKESAMLAERENKADALAGIDLSGEEADVADILIDLAMRDTMNQSKIMADYIVGSLNGNSIRLLERPLRSAGFAVLKAPDLPAILIEMGYLSSEREATLLNTQEYRNRLAAALAAGIDRYIEKRQLADTF